jgi:hypothetical protein
LPASFDSTARAMIDRLSWAPEWLVSLVVFAVALAAAMIVHRVIFRILTRIASSKDLFWRSLVSRGEKPTRFAIVVFALSVAAAVAGAGEHHPASAAGRLHRRAGLAVGQCARHLVDPLSAALPDRRRG